MVCIRVRRYAEEMDVQPKQDRPGSSHLLALVLCLLVAIPILYCLAIGPASILVSRGAVSQDGATLCYWPLLGILEESNVLQGAFTQYILWWYQLTGTPL